jgi:hypothetical protein
MEPAEGSVAVQMGSDARHACKGTGSFPDACMHACMHQVTSLLAGATFIVRSRAQPSRERVAQVLALTQSSHSAAEPEAPMCVPAPPSLHPSHSTVSPSFRVHSLRVVLVGDHEEQHEA